jgi:hypothetical protein
MRYLPRSVLDRSHLTRRLLGKPELAIERFIVMAAPRHRDMSPSVISRGRGRPAWDHAPGHTLFVNQQGDEEEGVCAVTYAIWGPWERED